MRNHIFFTTLLLFNYPIITNNQQNTHPKILLLKNVKIITSSLCKEFLQELSQLFTIDTFIETGTFLGRTTKEASLIFNTVHSIELSKPLYQRAQNIFKEIPHVKIHYGNSATVLDTILSTLPREKNVLFWLDSHYCKGGTKAGSNTPILQELETIKKSGITNAVILVDDICCFQPFENIPTDSEAYGFPTATALKKALLSINPNYEFVIYGDIAIAYPKKYRITPSTFLQACTMSRLFDSDGTITMEQLLNAEHIIAQTEGNEQENMQALQWRFGWSGVYYRLWCALAKMRQKNFNEAYKELANAYNSGYKSWRVLWHLAHTLYHNGETETAKNVLQLVIEQNPEFQQAKTFLAELIQPKRSMDCYCCKLLEI